MPRTIISASRRTDIPAFYGEWFHNRFRAGYCMVSNPYRPSQVRLVSLRPQDVAGFVFWTRHSKPFEDALAAVDDSGIPYYFLYSLLGYPRSLEPAAPAVDVAIREMSVLSERIGPQRLSWRYDPIILTDDLTPEWHRRNFTTLAKGMRGKIADVIVSVVDPYRKTVARTGDEACVTYDVEDYAETLSELVGIASDAGIPVRSCAEPALQVSGVSPGKCVDRDRLVRLGAPVLRSDRHRLRPGCLCDRSIDIGVNNTCGFGCAYCYATGNHEKARARLRGHAPAWNSLTGNIPEPD